VLATTIAADGTVSQTDSSVGTQEGLVVGGAITSGELGLLTLREQDAEASLFRVDFTVPSRGASVIASYEGTGVAPAAVVSAGGSSYVVVHARRYDPELVSQRPYAFPLSREGDALCLED
jgi:hypothetical protein